MSRESVLNAVRRRLGVSSSDQTRDLEVESRLASAKANTVPAVGQLKGKERIDQFSSSAERKGARVFHVEDISDAANQIMTFLPEDAHVALTAAAERTGIQLPAAQVDRWLAKSSLENCVSTCFCGIAETGSLAVVSSEWNALSQNFLADRHFVLLPHEDILDSMESVWQRVRSSGGMPRDLTLVSGPSSTGDIEMLMEKGAHGPRELIILVMSNL
jgi:L-lactate dehydrogenase complex protein LldG